MYSISLFILDSYFPLASPFIAIDSWPILLSQLFLLDNPIGITWSLIIEFKFYIFLIPFTFFISLINRACLRITIIILLTLFCLIYSYPFIIYNNTSLFPVLYIFLFGILTAEFLDLFLKLPRYLHRFFLLKQFKILSRFFFYILILISFVPLPFCSLMLHMLGLSNFVSLISTDSNHILAFLQPFQAFFWCLLIFLVVQKDYSNSSFFFNSTLTVGEPTEISILKNRPYLFSRVQNALDKFVFFPLSSISYAVYLFHPPIYFVFSKMIVIASIDSIPLLIIIFFLTQSIVLSFSWLITKYIDKPFSRLTF